MINILMIGSDPTVKGGITTVISQLDRWLRQNENINYFFISTYKDSNSFIKISFFILSMIKIILLTFNKRIDVAHIHMSYRGSYLRKKIVCNYLWWKKIPTILHIHGSEFKIWYDSLSDLKKKEVTEFLLKQERVLVLGDKWAEVITNIDKDIKVEILNNSVKITKEKVKWENQKKTVLFLGVLLRRKGIYDLIEAMNILKLDGYFESNNVILNIAGTGKIEKELKIMVKELELSKNILFLGWVGKSDLKNIILNSSIGVLPSYNEGLPMTILECMSYGLPMIATDVGSVTSVVEDNHNGLIVPTGNPKKISEAIKNMLESEEKWEKYSNLSKEKIESDFDEKKLFDFLLNLYVEVSSAYR